MRVKISEIRKLLQDIIIAQGVSRKDAIVIADEYLEGELQGKYSHGLAAFPSIVKKLSGYKFKKSKTLKKTHSLVFVDAKHNLGAIVGRQVADTLITMTKKEGVAVGFIKNMTAWLRPGTVAGYIAQKGLVSFVSNTGGRPMVAPPGGYDPQIGTNPVGIGIPAKNEVIVVDMATSKRAWGEVRIAQRTGGKLPQEAYLDKTGQFTKEAAKAYSAIGAGDYKGFALGMLVEVLGGSFLGMNMGQDNLKGDYRISPRGAFILVMNPRFTTTLKKFKEANSKLVKNIRKSKKRKGAKEIIIPGERAMREREKNMQNGYLEIDKKLWDELGRLAK